MMESNNECRCGELISPKRLAAGYFICLTCGEEKAEQEKLRKSRSIVPAYSKGAYVYITNIKDLKNLDPKHRS
jgi:DNA-directed RNA polymerase subunit M/transcription elongation factor TFIIS